MMTDILYRFGDTMNTTARMEQTSQAGRVQISDDTAKILIASGKAFWIEPREDHVQLKGKGEMKTWWIKRGYQRYNHSAPTASSHSGSESFDADNTASAAQPKERTTRLVDWNVETLSKLLKQVVARRNAQAKAGGSNPMPTSQEDVSAYHEATTCCFEEVKEIIALPEFNSDVARMQEPFDKVALKQEVVEQLRAYVLCISGMYSSHNNPFHNFEHASHVLMSVTKLMSRIVAPDVDDATADVLHDHTYG